MYVIFFFYRCIQLNFGVLPPPPYHKAGYATRGGGAPPLLKVIGTCRWTGYDFAGHQYWHRVSNRPNVVITIDTGYQIGLMWSSPLTQGIKIGLLGYGGLLRLSQDRMPIVFYDRPAIQAEAMTFFFFFLLVSSASPIRQGYIRGVQYCNSLHLNVFSKVYCDRVYFSCAERNYNDRVSF